jgi:hypothetical protein
MHFTLFIEAGDERNAMVRETIESVLGRNIDEVTCPRGTSDCYRMPFVRDSRGTAYFGVEGIRLWLDQVANRSSAASR